MSENPFEDWQIGSLEPGGDIPLRVLVQAAVTGTVDDGGIADHAESLFETLDERGMGAYSETVLLLIQYLMSGSSYGTGQQAAEQYLHANLPDGLPGGLEAMHTTVAAWIRGGRETATAILANFPDGEVKGAARYAFCLSVACSGLSQDRMDILLGKVTAGR